MENTENIQKENPKLKFSSFIAFAIIDTKRTVRITAIEH